MQNRKKSLEMTGIYISVSPLIVCNRRSSAMYESIHQNALRIYEDLDYNLLDAALPESPVGMIIRFRKEQWSSQGKVPINSR